MTQENKELLLKELCARLPHHVRVKIWLKDGTTEEGFLDLEHNYADVLQDAFYYNKIKVIKPYLFPISSMTEEQRIELYKVLGWGYESHYHLSKEWEDFNDSIDNNDLFLPASWVSDLNKMYDWLNKNHFDYRGLIEKGLAIDATDLNIY